MPGVLEVLPEDHLGLVWPEGGGDEWKMISGRNTGQIM